MRILILFLFQLISLKLIAQNGIFNSPHGISKSKNLLIFGVNYSYLPLEDVINNVETGLKNRESLFQVNLATDISYNYRIGVDYKKIYTNSGTYGKNNYYMLSIFNQYRVYTERTDFAFIDIAYAFGNYCTCGNNNPYKVEKLKYINFGLGYNVKLINNIRLDFAIHNANILTKIEGKYNFTNYVLGLDFIIARKKDKMAKSKIYTE